ncbi:unnamed protein product [Rhizophagus irregularis]|nr:unnamed protein product [Rhizophagus irregularis]
MIRKNAAFNAAKKVYDKGLYRARIINKWAKSWIENDVLPVLLQVNANIKGNNMEQKDPILPNGKKLHIFVTHDKCFFYANDDCPIIWAPFGEPSFRKKGQGKSIMVSDFLLETIGCLKLTDEQAQVYSNISQEARKFLRSGKNEEEWCWIAKHLFEQVKNNAIPIFEIMHSNAIAVFAFDNSTNHGAMADNALC